MAMALCESLPALMLLAYNNTLLTLFKWVEPFQHIHECFFADRGMSAPNDTYTWVENETPFFKVYSV